MTVARGALFGWMALGAVVGCVLLGFASTIVVYSGTFSLILTGVYMVGLVPMSVTLAAVAFAGYVVGQSRRRDGVLVPVITSFVFAAIVLAVGVLTLEWVRNLLFLAALGGAVLFAVGGSFVARARAARPGKRRWDAMPTWDEPSS